MNTESISGMNEETSLTGDAGNDTESTGPAAPEAPAAPLRRGGRIVWPTVALRLAAGETMTDVAAAAGCHRSTIWRRLQVDAGLRELIASEKARIAHEAAGRIDGLRPLVAGIIEREVRAGNLRVVLWLADRLRLTGASGTGLPGGGNIEDLEALAARAGMARLAHRARDAIAAIDAGAAPGDPPLTPGEPRT